MCGRYVLHLRPSVVRQRLADQDMPSSEAPSDDDRQVRQSYNFAPGQHGLIYRASTSDYGFGDQHSERRHEAEDGEPQAKRAKHSHVSTTTHNVDGMATKETKYKLQCAKWGLIPNWTRRAPDYANQMKTINCRDDSLLENRGLWNTMKARKRCIVVAEGFFEWLKKNNGKERVPHYVKRKDGQLMCFAGLWDVCTFESTGDKVGTEGQKIYSYTIITTDSNEQLSFLHDRMPVIFEPGSEEMKRWLDPARVGWDGELQKSLKPFKGALECYVVDKAVGKVGNDKPSFVVPIDSTENKSNIANFFDRSPAKGKKETGSTKDDVSPKNDANHDTLETSKVEDPESNAPLPKPMDQSENEFERALQQPRSSSSTLRSSTSTLKDTRDAGGWDDDDDEDSDLKDEELSAAADRFVDAEIKREVDDVDDEALYAASISPPRKMLKVPAVSTRSTPSSRPSAASAKPDEKKRTRAESNKVKASAEASATPDHAETRATAKNMRSATSNNTAPPKTPSKTPKDAKITSFFAGKS